MAAEKNSIDQAMQLANQLLVKMNELADKYSQPTWDIISGVIYYEGIYNVMLSLVLFLLSYIWIKLGNVAEKRLIDDNTSRYDTEGFYITRLFICWLPAFVAILSATIVILQFNTWLRIIDPKLYIARQLMEKVLN